MQCYEMQREIGFVPSTYEKQAVQRSENIRNSLGSNYKSAALNQLSYAGVPYESRFQRVDQEFVRRAN